MRIKTDIRHFAVILVLLLCAMPVFSQESAGPGQRDWWYTLERGKQMFRQGDYGNALMAFEDARRLRRAMFEQMEKDFIEFLSTRNVRRLGDSLEILERYIQDRSEIKAADALSNVYYRIPKDTLNDSATEVLTALGMLKDYPEAELWIGEIYLVEGELGLALAQFQKAYALRPFMENPGTATELLYKIASIRRIRQEYNEMERIMLSILAGDILWFGSGAANTAAARQGATATEPPPSFARQAMTRILENNGIDRFLTLYRYTSAETLAAHLQLGFYYYSSGRHSRAQEHLMFAFLIQNTVIINEIIRHRFDFAFTTLEDLAVEIRQSSVLLDYAEKNEYFKTAYYLGASLYGNGKTETARGIWNSLSTQSLAGEWQARAIAQLRSPHVERALEMP
jgi:tetratricopeptide (TPR) repeat protein